ncbi:MAG TPA: mechanosensitive ion channel family protein [Bradyrhizobium sp.]|nr:mechanosensitive ion channel family protein [Bradyrhizobium sp.]
MLVVAGVDPFEPTPPMDHTLKFAAISVFKIIWWLAASWLLVGLLRMMMVFERQPNETRFLQDIVAGIVYVTAVFAIIAYVFDLPIRGLLAASGVIAIVLGLALQSTLGDVFSGIVLNFAKPYHPGDWVILDGGLQGRIVETNWRATQILTPSNDLAIVPNNIIAKAKIINASRSATGHGLTIVVRLEPMVTPSRGCRVLEMALLSCNRILREPEPSVMVRSLDAVALECELQFFVAAIEQGPAAQNELFDLVFRHCSSAGIRQALPPQSASVLPPRPVRRDPGEAPRRLLDHLPIFALLTDDERTALAPKLKRRIFKAGDVLVEHGAVAQALSILSSGALIASQDRGEGMDDGEVVRLGPGDCFGEAGVLTGSPSPFRVSALTRGVVFEIDKDDLAPLLKQRPAIAAELGQILARREATGRARFEQDDHDRAGEDLSERLAERVRHLFGLV